MEIFSTFAPQILTIINYEKIYANCGNGFDDGHADDG
jgi:hypothetical protein